MHRVYSSFCLLFLTICVNSCKTRFVHNPIIEKQNKISTKQFIDDNLKVWHHKDIIDDSIAGTSLDKAYDLILKNKEGKEIIVAIIDMQIDINHDDLKNSIWINKKEIFNNKIDDDKNGYIDDLNGWNFLGNENGKSAKFVNYEYTRILKKYTPIFNNSEYKTDLDSSLYVLYRKAKKKHAERYVYAIEDTNFIKVEYKDKKDAEKTLSKYFKDKTYSIKDLDSLKQLHPKDSILQMHISWVDYYIKNDFTDDYFEDYKLKGVERLNKLLNVDYNDRVLIGDDSDDLSDTKYGNSIVNNDVGFFDHGTLMAGIIAANRNNDMGTKGVSSNIKIMPICVASFGDEHDKDIALAIRYAVDNGAKVINMSFGKEFSLYKNWVFDAFKYAEKNDVLIISSAGNSSYNLNIFNEVYPNDNVDNGDEVSDNFLMVGASNYSANENLFVAISNYGNIDVDVFAPGNDIFTTSSKKKKYKSVRGTSAAAAITSGIAALIYSYYPSLTASQVKHIIMDSGVEYTFPVKLTKNDTIKTPFNQLSKSGKIVNAYNALIVADSISKK
ncbi:S8 family serine peptidase [Olleya sp. Bg11-27]|uniref:S8 family serine peptidase n=1 Tax=Olleya sp. Bg11-27 TaxID=2058135 RepID=UPI000C2FFEDA|nr:S8 family serine peptidase [Olleya sp. Bg11-27]AUC74862.1 peptidase S8 [Olleya sp. Bg11-27]